ncbi:MAG: hypothetical protein JST00_02765 [Deltaproteobacteria bacterium]|nr:hypothetical protein [Deltaproteobacteria bacterium]
MKILYGIASDGTGQEARSRVLLDHLAARGHDLAVVATSNGRITAASPFDRRFRPDVVISDHDAWSWREAFDRRIPILSIDSMRILSRSDLPDVVRNHRGVRVHLPYSRAFVRSKLPLCDRYFVSSFFRPPIQAARTQVFAPVVRSAVIAAGRRSKRRGEHLLVVLPSGGRAELLRALYASGVPCRIYGSPLFDERVTGNLRERPFDEQTFVEDLASSRAVVMAGSSSLLGEALYLRKPVLAVALESRSEETLEARTLELEGFGTFVSRLDGTTLPRFLDAVPRFRENLAGYRQNGNRDLLEGLDAWLAEKARGRAPNPVESPCVAPASRSRAVVVDTAA